MNYGLIFAGGVGNRMNSNAIPKQFLEIHGKPIIVYTLEHFENHPEIDAICVVIVQEWLDYMKGLVQKYNLSKVKWIVPGGKSALESQYNGLVEVSKNTKSSCDVVLIHDGVRPLIDEKTISNCIKGVHDYGSAITVAPAIETIIRTESDGSTIKDTFSRTDCKLARAPQSFYVKDILSTHKQAQEDGFYSFIDSTSMMLHYGYSVHTVEGPSENIKVTTPSDFYACRALLDARENSQLYGI
ncbi:MAG: 2-C-methyl-D-erythritol 4-phosphate cytidylyltransferase [Saccharofermentans sp.]|nr:2-C-methyl-D-erythritol 4-phosphate cytidylyltransferase [Saccharofermentans sp.]